MNLDGDDFTSISFFRNPPTKPVTKEGCNNTECNYKHKV